MGNISVKIPLVRIPIKNAIQKRMRGFSSRTQDVLEDNLLNNDFSNHNSEYPSSDDTI
jgi:hypothetical protein